MDDDKKDALETFRKERRLLLAVAAVLLAHQILGVTVGKSAETLGLKIEFQNDHDIAILTAAIWLWIFVRYCQCLYTLRPAFPNPRADETLAKMQAWIVKRRLVRKHLKILDGQRKDANRKAVEITLKDRGAAQTAYKGHGPVRIAHYYRYHFVHLWHDKGAPEADEHKFNRSDSGDSSQPCPTGYFGAALSLGARAWAFIVTSYGTDYVLPGLIGGLPAAIWIIQISFSWMLPPLLRH
jgi:hypothetical protein